MVLVLSPGNLVEALQTGKDEADDAGEDAAAIEDEQQ
jgi:hypothetical protein